MITTLAFVIVQSYDVSVCLFYLCDVSLAFIGLRCALIFRRREKESIPSKMYSDQQRLLLYKSQVKLIILQILYNQ